jgi:hypothetical protein
MNVEKLTRVNEFDELIALLEANPKSEQGRMAHEHLSQARSYWLGEMDSEYRANLDLARRSIGRISEPDLREKAERMLSRFDSPNPE